MPASTACTTYATTDTHRPMPSQCTPDSPSSEDESGYEGDGPSDDEAAGVELITQDQAMWTIEQLEVLSTFKDEWVESGFDQQCRIVENAVKELLALGKQDPGPLRKKVRTWLRRKVKKRKAFGPGKAPTLHNVVAWYNDAELNKRVKEKHGVIPGDKARFIGLWKKELTAMVNDLKTNPANKRELKKIENQRTKWTEKGPPPDKRKWAAEKKAMDMVRNFAYDIYWETGARVVVTIGYRNTKNTVCVGQFDWNKYLGTNGTSFVDTHDAEAKPFVDKFKQYADENLTGDEAEDMRDVSATKAQVKLSKLKPDIIFQLNSKREPLLPVDCLDLKLDDKKHVFRCFLKSQYALAKDVKYPGSGCTPPWAKLSESPDRFFDSEDIPEVDYDDGRRKVTLQDPSRMKNHELTACLHLWQERQKETKYSFTFHHWWSEGQKGYVEKQEPRHFDTDDEDDADAAETPIGTVKGKGLVKKMKTDKEKKPKKKRKQAKTSEVHAIRDEKSKLLLQTKRSKNPTDTLTQSGNLVDASEKISIRPPKEETEEIIQDTFLTSNPLLVLPPKGLPPAPGSTVNDVFGSTSAPDNFESGPALQAIEQNYYPGPASPSITTVQTATIPIDPALTGFPTEGPNDHVPRGFHAIPHSMLPSHGTGHNVPGPPNPTMSASMFPTPAIPGTMSVAHNSAGVFTLERLGQIMLSLEARLSLQEQHQAKPEVQRQPIPPVVEQLTMEEDTIETRPRTWPTRATPPKTRQQATQIARDSKTFRERSHSGRTKVGTTHVNLEAQDKPKATRGTKRKVEEVQKSEGSSTKRTKTVKIEENEEKVTNPGHSVKPRPVTRRGVREFVDDDDHFRLRSRRKL